MSCLHQEKIRARVKHYYLFFIAFMAVLCSTSSLYIGLFWGVILGLIFAVMCIFFLFPSMRVFLITVDLKLENIAISLFLLVTFIRIQFFSYGDTNLFIPWEMAIWSHVPFTLMLALSFPIVMGYMILNLIALKDLQSYSLFVTSFFTGVLTMLIFYLVFDIIGVLKGLGMLLVAVIVFSLKLIKEIRVEYKYRKTKFFYISSHSLLLFIFAIGIFSAVYFSYGSFVKGDLWKQSALASFIQLNGLAEYFRVQIQENLFLYPSLFPYFLASMAEMYSLPLLNLSATLAVLIPGVSTLAVLNFFSVIEEKSTNRAKYATLVWLTFSGWGLLYLFLKYNTFFPPPDLAIEIRVKLGWGSGLIYSSSLGSFSHILRLFSFAGTLHSQSMLIREKISLKRFTLAICTMIVAIIFHPLVALLLFLFVWLTFLVVKTEIATRLVIALASSWGFILLFDYLLSPMPIYYNNLLILMLLAIFLVTLLFEFSMESLRLRLQKWKNTIHISNLLFKIVLLVIVLLYIYSLEILYWNYDMLKLRHFPIVPFYVWPNILGISGFLFLVFLGVIVFGSSSTSFSEKYFITFVTLVFLVSFSLDYNNVHQVINFFNPYIISFRLIPIAALGVSYLAGSLLYRMRTIAINSRYLLIKNYRPIIKTLVVLCFILSFLFVSILPRVSFWMEHNWPALTEKYNLSEERLLIIDYLRDHIGGDEFVAVEGGLRSPLGQLVSLSGAKVISKGLAEVLFCTECIESFSVLRETLNVNYIVVENSSNTCEQGSFLLYHFLNFTNPVFETNGYAIYRLPELRPPIMNGSVKIIADKNWIEPTRPATFLVGVLAQNGISYEILHPIRVDSLIVSNDTFFILPFDPPYPLVEWQKDLVSWQRVNLTATVYNDEVVLTTSEIVGAHDLISPQGLQIPGQNSFLHISWYSPRATVYVYLYLNSSQGSRTVCLSLPSSNVYQQYSFNLSCFHDCISDQFTGIGSDEVIDRITVRVYEANETFKIRYIALSASSQYVAGNLLNSLLELVTRGSILIVVGGSESGFFLGNVIGANTDSLVWVNQFGTVSLAHPIPVRNLILNRTETENTTIIMYASYGGSNVPVLLRKTVGKGVLYFVNLGDYMENAVVTRDLEIYENLNRIWNELGSLLNFTSGVYQNKIKYFDIQYPLHYGIFTDKEIKFSGTVEINTEYVKIYDFEMSVSLDENTPTMLDSIQIAGNSKLILFETEGTLIRSSLTNMIELKLKKVTNVQLRIKSGFLRGLYNGTKSEILIKLPYTINGTINSSTILTSYPEIIIEGNVSFSDVRLTWPYIKIFGAKGEVLLSGVVSFNILNTYDKYLSMRLTSSDGFQSIYHDEVRNELVEFVQYHNNISLFPHINMTQLEELYITIMIFLTFSLGYNLLVKTVCCMSFRKSNINRKRRTRNCI